MHLEIQIALNYIASNLYNKLPRRRIHLFTELLTKALVQKYSNHWYPQQPEKGSAYRCLKLHEDPLIKLISYECNLNYLDVLELMPKELCVWVDPGEVTVRGGGEEAFVLWSQLASCGGGGTAATAVAAVQAVQAVQVYEPKLDEEIIKFLWKSDCNWFDEGLVTQPAMISPTAAPPIATSTATSAVTSAPTTNIQQQQPLTTSTQNTPTPTHTAPQQQKKPPQLMTTAAFAQTKFGSTKLKSATTTCRRANTSSRMSPTEFSQYIKQKQLAQEAASQAAAAAQAAAVQAAAQQQDYYYWPNDYNWSNATAPNAFDYQQQVVAN